MSQTEEWFAVDKGGLRQLAHDRVTDHLSEDFYKELTRLAAKMVANVLDKPEEYRRWRQN